MTLALPNLTVLPDADAVARAIAEQIVALVRAAPTGRVTVALAGGSTPQRLYRLLATPHFAARIDWTRLHLFWGDERCVPGDDANSNARMVQEALIAHVPIPPANVHPIQTDAGSPEAAARLYEQDLQRHYGATRLSAEKLLFDLVLLGMGDDGHTASLFPGKPALAERAHWTVAVPEAGLAPFVPRVSLSFPTIASSRRVAILVTGAGKNATLRRVADGADLPVRHVTSNGTVAWYLDAAAAGS